MKLIVIFSIYSTYYGIDEMLRFTIN